MQTYGKVKSIRRIRRQQENINICLVSSKRTYRTLTVRLPPNGFLKNHLTNNWTLSALITIGYDCEVNIVVANDADVNADDDDTGGS